MNLELIATEELMDEVFRRFDVVFFAAGFKKGDEEYDVVTGFKGDGSGFLEVLSEDLCEAIREKGDEQAQTDS